MLHECRSQCDCASSTRHTRRKGLESCNLMVQVGLAPITPLHRPYATSTKHRADGGRAVKVRKIS
jgi:hypothetical protein